MKTEYKEWISLHYPTKENAYGNYPQHKWTSIESPNWNWDTFDFRVKENDIIL